MTTKLDARAKRSQQALLKSGMELLNVNRDASLSDIATHAGVGRATLYRQFDNRESLIKAVAIYCLERFEEATHSIEEEADSALDAIRLLFLYTMPLTQEFQFLSNLEFLAADDAEILAIYDQQKAELLEVVELAKTEKSLSKSLPSSWVANLIEGLFYAGWLQQQEEGSSAQEAAELAFRSFNVGTKPRMFR